MAALHPPSAPARAQGAAPAAPYVAVRDRVEDYFDRSATETWARLTSDAPVSRIRETVRRGRDRMRDLILSRLPDDLSGARVLDAGCGVGGMSALLAARGAEVVGVDVSPNLLAIAARRLPKGLAPKVTFRAGDMFDPALGWFDHVVAQDSMIYYGRDDLVDGLVRLDTPQIVFTVAPRTPLLMAMWRMGKLFPRADRSPAMVPQSVKHLAAEVAGLSDLGRVTSGFYISQALEVRR
ncbi:magnesium protoporphyrin IX methyltransferase [Jannaschia sp. Os4]|uniref:magnesium protoporphyrin IX methyltransferase n=1 Tax=Jannaschia sp. Os4 TaxID=2807617 RepID=UPI00193A796E|nr:magnesium protoporphyrin IX methyltransferase [Jannaschia sp. Os4]MBM2575506.1 magnesium protoporphyrin IX methyltransferase [Jannaschia sp. Os4]